jgi:hypothetical protein
MIGSRKTEFEYFDLDHLTVDGQPVRFNSATVTIETRKTQARSEWISDNPRWYGQIVHDFYRLDVRNVHTMVGHTLLV